MLSNNIDSGRNKKAVWDKGRGFWDEPTERRDKRAVAEPGG